MTSSDNSGNSAMLTTVPEDEFHAAMRAASVSALWERPDRPNAPVEIAHVWRWETMEPLLDAAVGETSMENAERRVLACAEHEVNEAKPATDHRPAPKANPRRPITRIMELCC